MEVNTIRKKHLVISIFIVVLIISIFTVAIATYTPPEPKRYFNARQVFELEFEKRGYYIITIEKTELIEPDTTIIKIRDIVVERNHVSLSEDKYNEYEQMFSEAAEDFVNNYIKKYTDGNTVYHITGERHALYGIVDSQTNTLYYMQLVT